MHPDHPCGPNTEFFTFIQRIDDYLGKKDYSKTISQEDIYMAPSPPPTPPKQRRRRSKNKDQKYQ